MDGGVVARFGDNKVPPKKLYNESTITVLTAVKIPEQGPFQPKQ